jgi:hypothetical protein
VHLQRQRKSNADSLQAYAGIMSYLAEHLSSLRIEITDLRNRNVLYSQQSQHSPVERTASDVRESRLVQIKQELSKMRNRPDDSVVWWGKFDKPGRVA